MRWDDGPGCERANAVTTRTLLDASGSAVTLPDPPRRIVSLIPCITEILFTLGLDESVAGVTRY